MNYTVKGYPPAQYPVSHVPDIRVGESVKVCVNPYRAPNIFVLAKDDEGNERAYECQPVERDLAGFDVSAPVFGENFSAMPDTDADRQRKEMAKDAYGAEKLQDVDKARSRRKPAFDGKVDPITYLEKETAARYMQRPGTPLDVPQRVSAELRPIPLIDALRQLARAYGRPLKQEENAWIRSRYPDGVPEEELEQIISSGSIENARMTAGL